MTKLVKIDKGKVRNRYAQQYKDETLALGVRVGIAEAARQLGLHESQLYSWRVQTRSKQQRSEAKQGLSIKMARLKRQLAEQAEELAKKAVSSLVQSTTPPAFGYTGRGRICGSQGALWCAGIDSRSAGSRRELQPENRG